MKADTFDSPERGLAGVSERIGCSYRQLSRWISSGVFGTEFQPGSGYRIWMDDREIEQAYVCARLVELGAQMAVLTPVVAQMALLAQDGAHPHPGDVLLVFEAGNALLWRRNMVVPPDPCWCIPWRTIDEIDERSGVG